MLKGEITVPDPATMLRDIEQMMEWKRGIMPEQSSRGSLLQLHALHYHDELLRDLDIDCERKSNIVAEMFGAYLPADYRGILSVHLRKKALPSRTDSTKEPGESDVDGVSGIDLSAEDLSRCDLRGMN